MMLWGEKVFSFVHNFIWTVKFATSKLLIIIICYEDSFVITETRLKRVTKATTTATTTTITKRGEKPKTDQWHVFIDGYTYYCYYNVQLYTFNSFHFKFQIPLKSFQIESGSISISGAWNWSFKWKIFNFNVRRKKFEEKMLSIWIRIIRFVKSIEMRRINLLRQMNYDERIVNN